MSAWHLIRRAPDHALFRASLRIGLVTAAISITLVQGFGFARFGPVGQAQPTKFGGGAGFTLLLGGLAVANWMLFARHAARGAADPALGRRPGPAADDPRPVPVLG
ncbi:hypothetical protein [Micromonospora haikouensis]|uniref:hypothetical protein n=1 Tax=Micromonospora haikouensis TaxID=686309 RepID=UPI003D916ECF